MVPADAIATLPKNTLLSINEDLSLSCFSFRSHPTFRRTAGLDALRRILGAYLVRNPGGYFRWVQSLLFGLRLGAGKGISRPGRGARERASKMCLSRFCPGRGLDALRRILGAYPVRNPGDYW